MSELFAGTGPLSRIALNIAALLVALTVHELGARGGRGSLGGFHRTARAPHHQSAPPSRSAGALAFLIAGYGWSRAVPVNAYALRKGRAGAAVAGAGPAANLVAGLLFATASHLIKALGTHHLDIPEVVTLLDAAYRFNLRLALLSIVPIPPLDAGHFLPYLVPRLAGSPLLRLDTYGGIALFVLAVVGGFRRVFDPAVDPSIESWERRSAEYSSRTCSASEPARSSALLAAS